MTVYMFALKAHLREEIAIVRKTIHSETIAFSSIFNDLSRAICHWCLFMWVVASCMSPSERFVRTLTSHYHQRFVQTHRRLPVFKILR